MLVVVVAEFRPALIADRWPCGRQGRSLVGGVGQATTSNNDTGSRTLRICTSPTGRSRTSADTLGDGIGGQHLVASACAATRAARLTAPPNQSPSRSVPGPRGCLDRERRFVVELLQMAPDEAHGCGGQSRTRHHGVADRLFTSRSPGPSELVATLDEAGIPQTRRRSSLRGPRWYCRVNPAKVDERERMDPPPGRPEPRRWVTGGGVEEKGDQSPRSVAR